MDLPTRKANRWSGFDYHSAGYYFITVCTRDKQKLLGSIVGADCVRPPEIILTEIGETVREQIAVLNTVYDDVRVVKSVIMPNHIHLILSIGCGDGGCADFGERRANTVRPYGGVCTNLGERTPTRFVKGSMAPTISQVMKQFKGKVSKQVGVSIWQRSFYDHIIRDEADYRRVWEYIDENPQKWSEDKYYTE